MTLENNRAPLLYYVKLCASFRIPSIRVKIGIFFFGPCELEIWQLTLRNNRAPLLCFKLCASFHSHWWIQTGVTVRNAQFGSKSTISFSRVTLKLDTEKQYGTSSKQHQALCIISSPYMNSNWSYGPETAKWPLWPWPLTLTFCMDITSVNGNNSRKVQDDTMTGTLSKLEIVDQWSTRIPPPHRRGWHCSKSQGSHFESDIPDNR